MNRFPLEIHPEAIAEARAAIQWYQVHSDDAAKAFLSELDVGIEGIQSSPELYPPYLHGTRCYMLRRFPYLIVYRITPSSIQVIAVAHGKRRPGYWKARSAG